MHEGAFLFVNPLLPNRMVVMVNPMYRIRRAYENPCNNGREQTPESISLLHPAFCFELSTSSLH